MLSHDTKGVHGTTYNKGDRTKRTISLQGGKATPIPIIPRCTIKVGKQPLLPIVLARPRTLIFSLSRYIFMCVPYNFIITV